MPSLVILCIVYFRCNPGLLLLICVLGRISRASLWRFCLTAAGEPLLSPSVASHCKANAREVKPDISEHHTGARVVPSTCLIVMLIPRWSLAHHTGGAWFQRGTNEARGIKTRTTQRLGLGSVSDVPKMRASLPCLL